MSDPTPNPLPLALRRPRTVLAVCVAAMLLGLASALTLRPGTAVHDMLPEENPSAVAFGRVLEQFKLVDDLVVLAVMPEGNPTAPEALVGFAKRLAADLEGHEDVTHVRFARASDRATLWREVIRPHALWYLDGPQRSALAGRLTPAGMAGELDRQAALLAAPGARPAELMRVIRSDPLNLRTLLADGLAHADRAGFLEAAPVETETSPPPPDLSADGRAILIRIGGTEPPNNLGFTHRFVDHVRESAAARNQDGLTLHFTGAYAIADYSAATTRRDMIVSLLVSLVLLSLLFLWVYRDLHALPMVLLTVNGGILVSFGMYALGRGQLTPVTAVCGAVLAGLGIDYCIHLLAITRAAPQPDPAARIQAALRHAGPMLFAACVSSAIGFGAVAFSGVRALTEFAVLGVLGLGASLGMALTFLPAFMLFRGARATSRPSRVNLVPALRAVALRPRPYLFATSVLLGMALGLMAAQGGTPWRFAGDLEAMHALPNPPLEAQAEVAQRFGISPGLMLVHVQGQDSAELLDRAHAAQSALRNLTEATPELVSVFGPADFLPRPDTDPDLTRFDRERILADYDRALAASPFDPSAFQDFRSVLDEVLSETTAPALADFAVHEDVVAAVLPRNAIVEQELKEALIVLTLATPWEDLSDRAGLTASIRRSLADVPGATLTGLAIIGADMQREIGTVLARLLGVAAVAVLVWLAVFFRNPWDVLLAMSPAAAGLIVLLAVLSATGTELHAVNLIALPLTLGLGVDDGIFLVSVARRARREKLDTNGFAEAMGPASHAIVMTSVTTALAFGSLAFTNTPAVQSLGYLAAVGVGTCLLASLAGLCPALLMVHTRRTRALRRHTDRG